MFTGLYRALVKLVSIDEKPNFRTHVVELPDTCWTAWKQVLRGA